MKRKAGKRGLLAVPGTLGTGWDLVPDAIVYPEQCFLFRSRTCSPLPAIEYYIHVTVERQSNSASQEARNKVPRTKPEL